MSDDLGKELIARYEQLCQKRDSMQSVFRLLAKYLWLRPIWFGNTGSPNRMPKLDVRDVSDDEVVDASRTAATALGGALWPNSAESVELELAPSPFGNVSKEVADSKNVRNWVAQATRILREKLDAPEAGLPTSWGEYLDGQIVMGTSGIFGVENDDDEFPFNFCSIGVETSVIDENANKVVDTVFIEFCYTVRQMMEKYGDKNSTRVKELYRDKKYDEWMKVVQAIYPRPNGKKGAEKWNRPIALVTIEAESKHVIENDGADEMPVFMTRFRKLSGELYGRSLGNDALPSIKELNLLRRGSSKALDKALDPPLGFWHDMIGGNGEINLSAGARVALYATGKIPQGRPPTEKLMDTPDTRVANERLVALMDKIGVKFMIDRLLDFNNKTRMTLGEAAMRLDIRNQALGNVFSRQITELLNPLVKWAVNVLWRRGLLGLHPERDEAKIALLEAMGLEPLVIPEEILPMLHPDGRAPFKVRFISPAARALQADALLGIEKVLNFGLTCVNGGSPEVMDNLNKDTTFRIYAQRNGVPAECLNGVDEVKKIRDQRAKAQAQAEQLMVAEQEATVADKQAKALKNAAQAQGPLVFGGPLGAA